MLDPIALGRRIADLREERHLTQEVLAKELGIPRTAISRLENGQRDISYGEMLKLAGVLGVEPEELAREDGFAEKFAYFRQTRPEQDRQGLEAVNEIIEAMLGYERLHRRFGLDGE